MFTFSEMLALVESESSFGAYVCHRRPGGSLATSDLVILNSAFVSTFFFKFYFFLFPFTFQNKKLASEDDGDDEGDVTDDDEADEMEDEHKVSTSLPLIPPPPLSALMALYTHTHSLSPPSSQC